MIDAIHIISRVKVYSEAFHPIQTAQGLRAGPPNKPPALKLLFLNDTRGYNERR
jgi:hypothetical protein